MNGRDRVVDPCCGHCLTGDHRRCYRGRLGCWCADRDHVDDPAMRARQHAYCYPGIPAPAPGNAAWTAAVARDVELQAKCERDEYDGDMPGLALF